MYQIKEDLDADKNSCICCFQEFVSEEAPHLDDVIDAITACFSIEFPTVSHQKEYSLCHSCNQRLTEAYQFRMLILDSLSKFHPPFGNPSLIRCIKRSDHPNESVWPQSDVYPYWDSPSSDARRFEVDRTIDDIPKDSFPSVSEECCSVKTDLRVNLLRAEHVYKDTPGVSFDASTFHIRPEYEILALSKEKLYFSGCRFVFKRLRNISRNRITKRISHENLNRKLNNEQTLGLKTDELKGQLNGRVQVHNLKCSVCPKSYRTKRELIDHTVCHLGVRPYECELCPKTYKLKKDLKEHLFSHSDVHNFKCDVCTKWFKSRRAFRQHFMCHNQALNFKCALCTKAFKSKGYLYKHMTHHNKASRFKCDRCPKTYVSRCLLEKHTLAHVHVRNFKCAECAKAFMTRGGLNRHMICHSAVRNFKCDSCTKSYTRRCDLVRHMVSHSYQRKYKCRTCSKSYNKNEQLIRHVCERDDT